VFCPKNKLNYNDSYFFKDQKEERKEIVTNDFSSELWSPCHSFDNFKASIFNAEIWERKHISLISFSVQSTSPQYAFFNQYKHLIMVNILNFKSILLHAICIAGTLFFTSSCSEKKPADSKDVAEQKNIASLETDDKTIVVVDNDNDAKFLMEAAEIQLEKISLGQLAQQKGSSTHVKALGKMMEEGHTKNFAELKVLAQSKSVSIPHSITEDSRETYEELDEKTGNDFGKAYSDMMVDHHEDAIELFEKTSRESEDSEIRNWATNKLPGLKTHLKHAEACKKECDKM
jgi:putative membrane protein